MPKQFNLIRIKRKTIVYLAVLVIALVAVSPALADYLGPKRTVTETTSVCKVNLNECQYVAAKGDYRYHKTASWSCSNESKPWKAYSSQPSSQGCSAATAGDQYWEQDNILQEVTNTYAPATINSSLQNCALNNGWCTTSPQLSLNGNEPILGQSILAIEGSLNGITFACSGSNCNISLSEGNNDLAFWALSSWGDSSTMGTLAAKVDSQLPSIAGTFSGTSGSSGWYVSPVSFNGIASDTTSGLASFTCTLDGVVLGLCTSMIVNGEGSHMLVLTARDHAGNIRTLTQNTSLDTQNPILSAALSGIFGSNNWHTAAALDASASDPAPGSGLSTFEYNLDNHGWITFPASGQLALSQGKHNVDVRVVDNAGRTSSSSKSFWLDTVAPGVTLDPVGTLGTNNWYTTNLNITASTSDEVSGIDIFEYSLDNSIWKTYSIPLNLSDGSHSFSLWAQDQAGLVTQVDRTFRVDTHAPQISGSLSGVLGTNGWYISDVTLSASASDPMPGSGLDAFTYIHNGNVEAPYTDGLILSDGENTIQLNAQDKAGLPYSIEQSVKVDTIYPSLTVQTILPDWNKDSVMLNGTSDDSGSGLAKLEISSDAGQTWYSLASSPSWSYIWNTTDIFSGIHNLHVRAIDSAGLTTEQNFNAGVDNDAPKISLPGSWYQWDTVTIDVWDDHSGLSETWVEISDPEERWTKRVIQLDPEQFPLSFKWDRRFGDDTIAAPGTYNVQVIAVDDLGNSTRGNASITILLDILPAGPTATPQPTSRNESTPTQIYTVTSIPSPVATQTAVVSIFGSAPEPGSQVTLIPDTVSTPRSAPSQSGVTDQLQSIFALNANDESVTEIGLLDESKEIPNSATGTNSSVLWGAAAAAMAGAVTAYALEERRKQQEEKERQAALEAREEERRAKIQARQMAKLEDKWAQEKAWEEARLEEARQAQDVYSAHMDTKMAHLDAEDDAKWAASQAVIQKREDDKKRVEEEKKKAEELQAGLAAYYNARKQGETLPTQKESWWQTTWKNAKNAANETIEWVDQHQTEIALGVGVAVGVGAIILSGGLATPLVAAAWTAGATAVAVGTIALGTVALNKHNGRDWNENLLQNVALAGAAALVVTGGWFLFQAASTSVGAYCVVNPLICSRVDPVFKAIDAVEEISLHAKLTYQTWRGDESRAADTAFELHSEYLDGGMPGNSLSKELREQLAELGEDAADLFRKYGGEIIPLLAKYGDAGLEIIQKYGDDGVALLQRYGDDGVELISKHGADAIDFVKRAEKLGINPTDLIDNPPLPGQSLEGWMLNIGAPNSPVNKQSNLKLSDSKIDDLLSQSIHNPKSNEFVLGYFDPNKVNGYMEIAEKRSATHLSMTQSLYDQVGFQDGTADFWQINRAAIQHGIDQRKTFVLSTDLEVILSNPEKYTYAEVKLILHPGNGYVLIHEDGYDMLVPSEALVP
jgi:hypothetical protein